MTNNIKSTPWAIPKIFTALGWFQKYFKGTATPNNIKKETPSARAVYRNNLNVFIWCCFFQVFIVVNAGY
jgi:hypothetical protein